MKHFLAILTVLMIISFGCTTPRPVQPAYQPGQVTASEEKPAEAGSGNKDRERAILEEELEKARRDRERPEKEELSQEKTAPFKDVHFDYDSYVVREESMAVLKAVGDWLKAHPAARVSAEGHCDERGTVVYNLALGQKRADAVKESLVKLGIDGSRIRVVSYGKEIPLEPGHTEEAWEKNRRVHFSVDQKR